MPWKKSEPMEEPIEFGLRAVRKENFRALCREYGITARTGCQVAGAILASGAEQGWWKSHVGRGVALQRWRKGKCVRWCV